MITPGLAISRQPVEGASCAGADQQSTPSAAIREVSRMPSQRASGLPGQEAPAVQPDAAQASSPFHTPPGSGVSSPAPASPLPVSTAAAKGSVSSSPEQQSAAASTVSISRLPYCPPLLLCFPDAMVPACCCIVYMPSMQPLVNSAL